jgi:hypothetical protein
MELHDVAESCVGSLTEQLWYYRRFENRVFYELSSFS